MGAGMISPGLIPEPPASEAWGIRASDFNAAAEVLLPERYAPRAEEGRVRSVFAVVEVFEETADEVVVGVPGGEPWLRLGKPVGVAVPVGSVVLAAGNVLGAGGGVAGVVL